MKTYWIYILTNRKGGTLYVGVTSNLTRRIQAHRDKVVPGFTKEYGLDRLIYFEQTTDVLSAIQREKRLKKWDRAWKIALVEKENPGWEDLSGLL